MIKDSLKELDLSTPSKIKALLELLKPLIDEDLWQSIHKDLNKEYKIAIVANMSAGKSTFINAMFADDVLPAYSEATSDCPVYIYSDDNPDNDKAIIEFMDSKKTMVLNKEKVKDELKFYAQKDSIEQDEQYKSVKRIDLYWNFKSLKNTQSSPINFVIIDTPGPNNTDEYQDKHQAITQHIILKEADMLLYLFDYGQIDSNLEFNKNNIWGLIHQRKKVNKNFEVFFVINKIDMAFEDNHKLSEIRKSETRKEFYENIKKFWFCHEQKAINKIKSTAEKRGFSDPKIFTASSEYQKLLRMKDISLDDDDKLDHLKKLFKQTFDDEWEYELKSYLKMNLIEDKTRLHLEYIEKKIIFILQTKMYLIFKSLHNKAKVAPFSISS